MYLTEEDKTKAAISNERRIKSAAINMIFKQMKRLTGLQHLKMSLLFVIRDEGQQRQLIKFAGKGDFLRKLESGEAIMSPQELKKSRKVEESFLPRIASSDGINIDIATPSKLPCGPGVSRMLAQKQMETLKSPIIDNTSPTSSLTIDVTTPKRKRGGVRGRGSQRGRGGRGRGRGDRLEKKAIKRDTKRARVQSSSDISSENEADDFALEMPWNETGIEKLSETDNEIGSDAAESNHGLMCTTQTNNDVQQIDPLVHPFIVVEEGQTLEEAVREQSVPSDIDILENLILDPGWEADQGNDNKEQDSDPDVRGKEKQSSKSAWETGLYYAVGFENRWYPGLVLEIKSKDSARMKFLEPVGKRFKWPTKDDIVDVDIKAKICEVEITPNATGRLWTVQNVDRIEEKFINGSY